MSDDTTSAVHELDDRIRNDLRAARSYAVGDGEGLAKKRPVITLALVAFVWTVFAFACGIIFDAGGVASEIKEQGKKLDAALLQLATIEAAQRESDLDQRTLLVRVDALEAQLSETRGDVSTMERQMAYRLQMEAAIRQIHPGVNWP